jgi:hypothetical protein
MAFSGKATTSATTPAATSVLNSGDLVNVPVAYPSQERYPGGIDPSQYTDEGPEYPIEGPPAGTWTLNDWPGKIPPSPEGGGIQDTSWMSGTDGPQVPWDSVGGGPTVVNLSYPGPNDPALHGEDTGAVYQAFHATPANIGSITRRTILGETMNREYAFDPVTGEYVPQPNGRSNMDQIQFWEPNPIDGDAPFYPGYAERPIFNNVAYEATQVNEIPSPYGVAGQLPDRSPYNDYAATAYTSPADPSVSQPPAASDTSSSGGGWLLG